MKKKQIPLMLLSAAALCGGSALAEVRFGENLTLSGFGTLGLASSDGDVDFVRDGSPQGASNNASWKVDSKLGLQADLKATSWLSGTVQVLSDQRYKPGIKSELEWAFVKLKPMDGLNIRVGRTGPAIFMVSDSRSVGYANTMVRQPNEVYSLASLHRLEGVDVAYSFGVAGTTLTLQAMAGNSELGNSARGVIDAKKVRGINAVWDTRLGSFRLGRIQADAMVPSTSLPPGFIPPGSRFASGYTFSGLGYLWDDGASVVAAEYVKREVAPPFKFFGNKGWYVMGGYRFGNFLPYVMVAEGSAEPGNPVVGDQRTLAAGVRWDVVSGAAIKLQLEHVDPKGTVGSSFSLLSSQRPAKTNVLSITVDFVF